MLGSFLPDSPSCVVVSTRFRQDPFKEIPVIWVILHEEESPRISSNCKSPAQNYAIPQSVRRNTMFERATVVLLSDYALAVGNTIFFSLLFRLSL